QGIKLWFRMVDLTYKPRMQVMVKPKVRNAKYFREQMLLAIKDEAESNLSNEENDFMLDNAYGEETLDELIASVIDKLIVDSPDSKETLEDAKENRIKMRNKIVQINYAKLNALYEISVPEQEYSAKQTYFSIPSTSNNGSESKYVPSESPVIQLVLWIVDSGCSKHMTSYLQMLRNFVEKFMRTIRFRNDHFAVITRYGDYVKAISQFVMGLGHNLFSVGQFCDRDLKVSFRSNTCYVWNLKGDDLLTGSRDSNLYTISIIEMAASSPVCLMSKATSTKSSLWHRRLSHLNFGTINQLTSNDLVDGLPKFKYNKDHLCSAYLDNLFGPMYKEYYATSSQEVFDNSTANNLDNDHTSSSSSIVVEQDDAPQIVSSSEEQFANEPNSLVLNKVADESVQKDDPSNMHQFHQQHRSTDSGLRIIQLNKDGENLNKMKEKGDECIFVGYSTQSRAFRVFNKRTRVITESIHVNFDELPQMASAHNSSDPAPTCQTLVSVQISSDPAPECQTMALEHDSLSLDRKRQENVSHGDKTVTMSNELDLLFSLMFDELLNGSSKVVSKSSAVSAADAPNESEPHAENDEVADDEFINIFSTPVQDQGETSSRHVHQSSRGIFICQLQYSMDILTKHGMEKCDTDSGFQLITYADADHARCNDDCKSTSGGIQFLEDKLVSWSSKKQDCTTMSSAKAEYDFLTALFHIAQHVIPAVQLIPKYQPIRRCNDYAVLQSIPCSPKCKFVGKILLDHPLSYALTATANVPDVYLQQFWRTMSKVRDTEDTIKFLLNIEQFIYTVDMFRDTLNLPVENPEKPFVTPANIQTIEAFMNKTMFKVFNRCLTTRTSRHDQTKINILQLFHVVVNVDYAALLWWDFMNNVFQKKEAIKLEEDYHSIKDDVLLVSVYATRNVLVRGMLISNAFLTTKIRETDDFRESTPRAIRSPTLTASPQGKKRKQSAGESNSQDKLLRITIRQQKVVKRDHNDDESGDRLEPGSHKEHPKIVDDDDDKVEKRDDDLGSLEIRAEETQTTIPTPPSSLRKILSSDKKVDQELTNAVVIPTTITSKRSHSKHRISSKYSHLPGALRRMCKRQGDDDIHSHHDDHQEDDAPPEGEKRVKRHKALKFSKSAREETVIDEDEVIPKDKTLELITEL
nr:integrase, catalytic region, zinc finger, CCHC-type, peptidase aspartic, catalytic [Tanacetum cinerariifolium]